MFGLRAPPIGAATTDLVYFSGPPTVTSITPYSGPTSGGTKVQLHGTGFTRNREAAYGGVFVDMQNQCSTGTECTVTRPASNYKTQDGWVDVIVANLNGTNQSAPSATRFHYLPFPKAFMQPSSGPPFWRDRSGYRWKSWLLLRPFSPSTSMAY